jgi:hypothetical protein
MSAKLLQCALQAKQEILMKLMLLSAGTVSEHQSNEGDTNGQFTAMVSDDS